MTPEQCQRLNLLRILLHVIKFATQVFRQLITTDHKQTTVISGTCEMWVLVNIKTTSTAVLFHSDVNSEHVLNVELYQRAT